MINFKALVLFTIHPAPYNTDAQLLFNKYSGIRNSEARVGSGNEQKEMVKDWKEVKYFHLSHQVKKSV